MSQNRVVLFALVPLFCTGLALAQPPAPPTGDMPGMGHHRPDPATMAKEMCSDRLAWQVARLAYLESKLDLTDAQRPLFNKWRQRESKLYRGGRQSVVARHRGGA